MAAAGPELRCAFCLDALGAAAPNRCDACGTLLHRACAVEASRCPTLGCPNYPAPSLARVDVTGGASTPEARLGRRRRRWGVLGIWAPLAAFACDIWIHQNPLAWGPPSFLPEPHERVLTNPRMWGLMIVAALSALGMARARRGRADGRTVALLGLGLALATLHVVVFAPILPLSVGAALVGIGFLGLTPFTAWWVYLDAMRWAVAARASRSMPRTGRHGRRPDRRPPALAIAAGLAVAGLARAFPVEVTIPAPAAARVEGQDLEALRRAALQLAARVRGPAAIDERVSGSLPEPLGSVARDGSVHVLEGGEVRVIWSDRDEGGLREPYALVFLADGQDLPSRLGPTARAVELAPGVWSHYIGVLPARTGLGGGPAVVRLARSANPGPSRAP